MSKYRNLLFDVDGTLLDFKAAEKSGLRAIFRSHGYEFNPSVEKRYNEINGRLWLEFEQGKITRDTVINTRFQELFDSLGIKADGVQTEREYREQLNRSCDRIEGALEICKKLSVGHTLYIVSNGVSKTQHMRLEGSGLAPYFRDIFVSEDTGFQKPQAEFFSYCFHRIPGFRKEETLIIGDSLSSDILGGNNAGIDTCWYHPGREQKTGKATVTFEISSLLQLESVLQ